MKNRLQYLSCLGVVGFPGEWFDVGGGTGFDLGNLFARKKIVSLFQCFT